MRVLTMVLLLTVVTINSFHLEAQEIFPNCLRNDVNEDGAVTVDDLELIQSYLNGQLLRCEQILHADVNRDWEVDVVDYAKLRNELLNPSFVVYYTWGDINGDDWFTVDDLGILRDYVTGVTQSLPELGYDTGDISGDGIISSLDLDIFEACVENLIASPFISSPY